jgi:hypothetical protein
MQRLAATVTALLVLLMTGRNGDMAIWRGVGLTDDMVACEDGCTHDVANYSQDGLSCRIQGNKAANSVITTQSFDLLSGGNITVVWSVLVRQAQYAQGSAPLVMPAVTHGIC